MEYIHDCNHDSRRKCITTSSIVVMMSRYKVITLRIAQENSNLSSEKRNINC